MKKIHCTAIVGAILWLGASPAMAQWSYNSGSGVVATYPGTDAEIWIDSWAGTNSSDPDYRGRFQIVDVYNDASGAYVVPVDLNAQATIIRSYGNDDDNPVYKSDMIVNANGTYIRAFSSDDSVPDGGDLASEIHVTQSGATMYTVGVNTITGATNNITATSSNNIQGPVNNIGTTGGATVNTIGNTNAGTTVTTTARNASQTLANGSANTSVIGGVSGLAASVTTAKAQVLLTNTGGTTVDADGKILTAGSTGYVAPTAPTAALTLTNGYGNTHGMVVTESQTTVSGGTQSSSLTLSDANARFSRASDGAPITVTGVADGKADFDAVNVRQFAGAIAGVTAMANIPAPEAGKNTVVGVAVGGFMSKSALALGLNHRVSSKITVKASLASGLNKGAKPIMGAGMGWSW